MQITTMHLHHLLIARIRNTNGSIISFLTIAFNSDDIQKVANDMGKDSLELNVRVLDKPEPVRRLRAEADGKEPNSAIVSWEEPKDHGGSPITGYLVEKRVANKRTWTPLGSAVPELSRCVTGLTPNTSYFFRVMAQNNSGCSEPVELEMPLVIPSRTSKLSLYLLHSSRTCEQ